MRPRLLDLFCGAGGAAVGYDRAGWDLVGVDIAPQPNYPFEFHQGDALDVLRRMAAGGTFDWLGPTLFGAVHLSPPCQGYTALKAVHGNEWPMLVEPVRGLMEDWRSKPWGDGLPYVIENVQGSPLRRDLTLCGEMFGLSVIRHRYFELGGWSATQPEHVPHRGRVRGWRHGTYYDGPYLAVHGDGGGKGTVPEWQAAMGIDWTDTRHEIAEAIPPAYTEWIGRQLLDFTGSAS